MKLELTANNGSKYTFKDFGKEGDYIMVKYTTKEGKIITYMIRPTNNDKILMS